MVKQVSPNKKYFVDKEVKFRLLQLLASGKSYEEAAKESGLIKTRFSTPASMKGWISTFVAKTKKEPEEQGVTSETVEMIEYHAKNRMTYKPVDVSTALASQFENIAKKSLKAAGVKAKYEKAGLKDLISTAALAVDKSRLLRGESTDNIAWQGKINFEEMKGTGEILKFLLQARGGTQIRTKKLIGGKKQLSDGK